jgi:hypothetical protein
VLASVDPRVVNRKSAGIPTASSMGFCWVRNMAFRGQQYVKVWTIVQVDKSAVRTSMWFGGSLKLFGGQAAPSGRHGT